MLWLEISRRLEKKNFFLNWFICIGKAERSSLLWFTPQWLQWPELSWSAAASSRSPTWIQGPMGLALLPSQATCRELDQKWRGWDMNKHLCQMLAPQGERWGCCSLVACYWPHLERKTFFFSHLSLSISHSCGIPSHGKSIPGPGTIA